MYEYQKYVTDTNGLKDMLTRYGVAIIPNVLSDTECTDTINGMWTFFETLTAGWDTPIRRNDSKTWKNFTDLMPLHNMLIQQHGVGHADVSWQVRQKPQIVDIFARFYDVDPNDLLVSFDGLSFHLPHEKTKIIPSNKTWFHTDQSYTRNEFECVQSWVTAGDVNDGDATLAILEGSNKYHKDFAEHFHIADPMDWYKLNQTEEKFYTDRGCVAKKIKCPKGSLVLWDSRTIHYGAEPLKDRETMNLRAIIYLCYMPRTLCSESNLEKKRNAFNTQSTTNHYPCNPKLFPFRTRKQVKPVVKTIAPVLNDLGRRLAGF